MARLLTFTRAALLTATLSLASTRNAYAQTQAASGASGVPMVWVHLDGPEEGMRVELKPSPYVSSRQGACLAPCDRWLPSTGPYFVAAPDRRDSKPFWLLAVSGERETIHARGGSPTLFVLGAIGFYGGIGVAGFGTYLVLADVGTALLGEDGVSSAFAEPDNLRIFVVGTVMLLAGSAVAVLGGLAKYSNSQMLVIQGGFGQFSPGGCAAPTEPPTGRLPDEAMLLRDPKASAAGGELRQFPPANGVPLLSGTF